MAFSTLRRFTRIPPRSKRMSKLYGGKGGRRAFVARFLSEHRLCQAKRPKCTRYSRDVHEKIPRSHGGAILPGPVASAQRQVFFAVCRGCHDWIGQNRREAARLGLLHRRGAE